MISRLARPALSRREASSRKGRSTSASARASPAGKTAPFTPGRTKSGQHPTRSLAITGLPAFITSFTTKPNGS
ncbi:MAG TPA: hypothetical protein DIT64_18035 [Verrucomicrobiales bacterium]|nr:hypothetical protein [Verrucomicrobiales bacterium]